jgi:uncharacterized protein YigA (DUF484 family)
MDGSQGGIDGAALAPAAVRRFLADNPEFLREDDGLLQELGLKVDGGNVVDFGPAAIARVHAAHQREAMQRQQLEEIARANFSAQAQTHGAVVDLLDARDHADLAHRLNHLAQHRFGLAAAVIALEGEGTPAGWRLLVEGQVDLVLGDHGLARMGVLPTALGLFEAPQTRQGLLAFGSSDPEGFTPDMGPELVAFLARVVERTAERWPLL